MSAVTQVKTSTLLRRLWRRVRPFWPLLVLGLVLNASASGIDAGFTYMIKPFLNKSFIDKDLAFVKWIPLMLLVGIIARGMVNSGASYCMTWVARSVVKVFRQRVFAKLLTVPASYYDSVTSGQLLSKLVYDVEQIAQVSADALTTFVQSACLLIGLLAVMFVISWQLSLFFLTSVPFVALIVSLTNKRIRRVSHDVQNAMGQVTETAEEVIEGYKVVRMFGGQDGEQAKFDKAAELNRHRDMKVAVTKALNVAGVQSVIAIAMAIIIFAAIKLSGTIAISAGGFISLLAAMLQMIKPMKNLTTVNSVIQRGLAGAQSVFDFLDLNNEVDEGSQSLRSAQGQIEFNQVNFTYPTTQKLVLNAINLKIRPGETIALVGRSGAGKSTLVNCLPRFYDISSGSITLDGINIQNISLDQLRSHIAIVSQHVTLFNDTIAANIAYGCLANASMADIKQAAIDAHAFEFIENLPKGFNTIVGENGVLLSGGQRQRLAIARAILKDAPILILDEATSALDTESERFIQAALDRIMLNRTTLVIAHRLSTIEKADRIAVLDHGRIIELGTHAELLKQNTVYARLHELQFNVAKDAVGCVEVI